MSHPQVEKYGHASGITEEDVEQTQRFLRDTSWGELDDWAKDHTETHHIGPLARPFQMVVERQSATEAVVVTGEFGNGIAPHAVARARAVRDRVAPDASLLMQPNAAFGQFDNMNFSLSERAMLRRGLLLPVASRLDRSLEQIGDPDQLTFYGPSQGGVVALDYAARLGGPVAVAVIETPNVADRSPTEMARDFLGCGALLKEVMAENYSGDETLEAGALFAPVVSLKAMTRFIAGLPHPDNRAMINVLRTNTAQERMESILDKDGSVVHAYAQGDNVSPLERNDAIARQLDELEKYQSVHLEGDHSITNNIALSAALARTARQLLQSAV